MNIAPNTLVRINTQESPSEYVRLRHGAYGVVDQIDAATGQAIVKVLYRGDYEKFVLPIDKLVSPSYVSNIGVRRMEEEEDTSPEVCNCCGSHYAQGRTCTNC